MSPPAQPPSADSAQPDLWPILILGRDKVGVVATDGCTTYYLTDCCGASAKGLEHFVGCRSCYQVVDPALGDVPDATLRIDASKEGVDRFTFEPHPIEFVEVYGDGITYDQWRDMVKAGVLG